MDQQGAVGPQDLKKDRSKAQEGLSQLSPFSGPSQTLSALRPNGSASHSPSGVLPNGVRDGSEAPPETNGDSSTSVALAGPGSPPSLDQSWRSHHSNKSLGTLMERTAQQCYYDLNQTLTKMSEVSVEPQQQQANGVVTQTQDTSEGSLKRKRMIMDFANNQRERFIKTLVLSDWCRNEDDKSRLIDVKVWQDKQREAYTKAARAVGQTKLDMIAAKMPNPNIEGAMELLATGKASWVPDLNYIPPKRLTAKQLLKTLRNMNVALATRLNLHEELPPHFQDFSIADGRATFTVRDEFEVELSVADEDPATPFYFIDIRCTFHPASNILDDRLRGFVEARTNQELATKGLKGCYDFLHNFVLTHKINVLRSQALELMRGKWFDCIRIESLRRNLVVQYWAGMPGPKSWIEIGISSGKQKGIRARRPPTPQISVRWFRRGVEVKDDALDFDWRDLSLEKCISTVIGKHSAWIMSDLQTRIRNAAPAESLLSCECSNSESPLDERVLSLDLPSLREPLKVRVEFVTGQYSITPPSLACANTERRLNSDPSADPAKWLPGLTCAAVQERVRKEAGMLSWAPPPNLVRQDNLEKLFEKGLRHFSVFKPGLAWGDRWALAITFNLAGEKWWAVSLEPKQDTTGNAIGNIIASSRRIPLVEEIAEKFTISQATLVRMEKVAVAEVAFGTLSTQLKDLKVPHTFEKLARPAVARPSLADRPPALVTPPSVALFVRFSPLMKKSRNKAWKPWADELVRLTHHGIAGETEHKEGGVGNVRHDLRLSLERGKMKELQKHITSSKEPNLAMNATGGLALRMLVPFGKPFAEQMQKRLESIERLDDYVALLKKRHFDCTHVSLSRLTFVYDKDAELVARIDFSNDGGLPARLKLEPTTTNPHNRVRVFLENGLNNTGDFGFEALTFILSTTLPVLQWFERVEALNATRRSVAVHPRSSTWYSVKYATPLPSCSFQLRANTKTEGKKKSVRWAISDMSSLASEMDLPDELAKALKELWHGAGEHWHGVGNGIIADSMGIGEALVKVDEVIRRFEVHAQPAPAEVVNGLAQPAEGAIQPTTTEPPKDQGGTPTQPPKKQPTPQSQPSSRPASNVKSDPDIIMLD